MQFTNKHHVNFCFCDFGLCAPSTSASTSQHSPPLLCEAQAFGRWRYEVQFSDGKEARVLTAVFRTITLTSLTESTQ